MCNIGSHCLAHIYVYIQLRDTGIIKTERWNDGCCAKESSSARWLVPDLDFFFFFFIRVFSLHRRKCIHYYTYIQCAYDFRYFGIYVFFQVDYMVFVHGYGYGYEWTVYVCVFVFAFVCMYGGCTHENDYFISPQNIRCIYLSIGMLCFREKQTHKLYTIKQN